MCQETHRGETSAWGKCEMEEIEPHEISRVSTLPLVAPVAAYNFYTI